MIARMQPMRHDTGDVITREDLVRHLEKTRSCEDVRESLA